MTLFELGLEINAIVKGLKLTQMNRDRDPDDSRCRIDHALGTALELARKLEEGWGDDGVVVS